MAGYRAWQSLGRQVRRIGIGIQILMPMPMRDRGRLEPTESAGHPDSSVPHDRAGDPAISRRGRLRFGIGQTEGEPLPTIDVPVLADDDGAALYARMERLARDEGLAVRHGSPRLVRPEMMGFYSRTERLIVVREAARLQMAKTLSHELAHHFGDAIVPSSEEETIAESVAYVVCAHAGLDTGERSFPYVATWSRDTRLFRRALARIGDLSRHLIDRLEQHEGDLTPGVGKLGQSLVDTYRLDRCHTREARETAIRQPTVIERSRGLREKRSWLRSRESLLRLSPWLGVTPIVQECVKGALAWSAASAGFSTPPSPRLSRLQIRSSICPLDTSGRFCFTG